jgi:hypothetical protein
MGYGCHVATLQKRVKHNRLERRENGQRRRVVFDRRISSTQRSGCECRLVMPWRDLIEAQSSPLYISESQAYFSNTSG